MDIFFQDPSEVPLPPSEVRIRELRAEPWPDGRRVKVYLEVDPFQRRPHAEIFVRDSEGELVAQVSVIEPMSRKMEFTIHIRLDETAGDYSIEAILFYTEPIPEPVESDEEQAPPELPEHEVVDRKNGTFTIAPAAEEN